MAKLLMFNSVTLDGYFCGPDGDLSWAHVNASDKEWSDFVHGNAGGDSRLLFGRVTYDMMRSFWPTPAAAQVDPVLADRMNNHQKVVFSRTMTEATWTNTRLIKDDLVGEVRRLKADGGPDMTILGSGSVVSQLTGAGLIDDFQLVVVPIVLGAGTPLFADVGARRDLQLTSSRAFSNGRVVLSYTRRG